MGVGGRKRIKAKEKGTGRAPADLHPPLDKKGGNEFRNTSVKNVKRCCSGMAFMERFSNRGGFVPFGR